jgi:hypothetical protein
MIAVDLANRFDLAIGEIFIQDCDEVGSLDDPLPTAKALRPAGETPEAGTALEEIICPLPRPA